MKKKNKKKKNEGGGRREAQVSCSFWRESEMILPSVLSEASSLEAKRGGEQRDTPGGSGGIPRKTDRGE